MNNRSQNISNDNTSIKKVRSGPGDGRTDMTHRRADHNTTPLRSGPDGRTDRQTVRTNCTSAVESMLQQQISRCKFCCTTRCKTITRSMDIFQICLQVSLHFCKQFFEVRPHHLGMLFCSFLDPLLFLLHRKKCCNGMLLFLRDRLLHSGSFLLLSGKLFFSLLHVF